MASNTINFTELLKKTQNLCKIQKEQEHKKKLNDTADEDIASFSEELEFDINNNSVKKLYRISEFEFNLGYEDDKNKICSEFSSIINEKLVKFGFTGFILDRYIYMDKNYSSCIVSIHPENKLE